MNRKLAIDILVQTGNVVLKCNGNSMRPLMKPGDALHIKKVSSNSLRKGDAVFCKVNSGLQVHILSAIDNNRYLISNHKGRPNGWIHEQNIYGLCVAVNDRTLLNEDDLKKRINAHV